ncbi:hypothetical protein LPN04_17370 [Rugamonas sp. A1-17]|nr:hypothetical protein [Rugamonas sp. A1-17]
MYRATVKFLCMLVLAMTLFGCATTNSVVSSHLPDGVWSGQLKSVLISADESVQEGKSDLLIASCKGIVRFWASDGDGGYRKLGNNYVVNSYPDSHLIYFLDAEPKQPDWVEIQSYSFLEIDSDLAVLQWNRAVNNRDVAKTEKNRYFFSHGITQLRRESRVCDGRLVP